MLRGMWGGGVVFYPGDGAGAARWADALGREGIVVAPAGETPAGLVLTQPRDLPALLGRGERAVAVIVVEGPTDPRARARLLDAGALDVLAAPTSPVELAARLRVQMRLGEARAIRCADLRIDPLAGHAERAGRALPLHPREYALLAALAEQRGRPVGREALLGRVWRLRFDPGTNVVAVTVSRLRAKVDRGFARPLIHTVGSGYMLSETVAAR